MMLENKLAIISGAGQGNGAAIAKGMAREGARVIVTDINADSARATAEEITTSGGKAWHFKLDVANADEVDNLARTVSVDIGLIDILVNNAGICPRNKMTSDMIRSDWRQAMSINLDGVLNLSLSFLSALKQTKGTIINISSIASYVSTATSIAYASSKGGVKMLTQNMAHELAVDGVRVNAIAPGTFATAMTEATRNDPARRERFVSRIPMGRFGEPEELVGPVLFLASQMSSYVTGTTIVVDGGYLAA